ncbi:hypothetical protein FRC0378_02072 [Corynebacterium diphtheriae]|nr:hypothetical protein FRC0378_02072 [Corynebacterium diphtheriae]
MAALLLTVAAVLGLVIVANATGVVPVGFVVTTTLLGLGLAPFVGDSLERHIPSSQWDRISLARDASRRWGVEPSNAFFPWIGCNRLIFPPAERSGIRGDEGLGVAIREAGGRRPCMGVPAPCRYRGLGRCGRWMGVPCVSLDGRGHLPPLSGLAADPCADPIEGEVRPMAGHFTRSPLTSTPKETSRLLCHG